jgi:hypothetical protein
MRNRTGVPRIWWRPVASAFWRADAEVETPSPWENSPVYEFIKAHRAQYSVQMMCGVLEVVQSGYYGWLAVRRRRPRGVLIRSDQGTQYGSDAWRRFCRSNRLEPSMNRRGNTWLMPWLSPSSAVRRRSGSRSTSTRIVSCQRRTWPTTLMHLQSNAAPQPPRRRQPRTVRGHSQDAALH